jgi:hypothetical protein
VATGAGEVKSDQQLRQEIAANRKLLRERKRKNLGLPSMAKKSRQLSRDGQHEYIFGLLAKTKRRLEVYRAAGGEADWFDESDPESIIDVKPAMCQGCEIPHAISWNGEGAPKGEWQHDCALKKKCDSVRCSLYVCFYVHQVMKKSEGGIHGRQVRWKDTAGIHVRQRDTEKSSG